MPPLAVLALLVLLVPPALAQECRTDRLGNTVCRDLPGTGEPLQPLPRPAFPVAPGEPQVLIPSMRRNAFGEIRRDPGGLVESPRFGTPPRPDPVPPRCRTDAFGNVICR